MRFAHDPGYGMRATVRVDFRVPLECVAYALVEAACEPWSVPLNKQTRATAEQWTRRWIAEHGEGWEQAEPGMGEGDLLAARQRARELFPETVEDEDR